MNAFTAEIKNRKILRLSFDKLSFAQNDASGQVHEKFHSGNKGAEQRG